MWTHLRSLLQVVLGKAQIRESHSNNIFNLYGTIHRLVLNKICHVFRSFIGENIGELRERALLLRLQHDMPRCLQDIFLAGDIENFIMETNPRYSLNNDSFPPLFSRLL